MKRITRKQWLIIGEAILAIIIIVLLYIEIISPSPKSLNGALNTATSTVATSTSTHTNQNISKTKINVSVAKLKPFPINKLDKITSWSFKGAYSSSAKLTAKMNTDIKHLTSLLGKGKYDVYDLYNGIANDYMLLGNGKMAYQYYNRSIKVYPDKGLAYANLAHLMDELGAYHTAADVYAKAVHVEPSVVEYHVERLTFLTRQFSKDTARIKVAFADSNKQFGDIAQVVMIEAQWLASERRYADAISAWKRVKLISPGRDMTAVNTEIVRLQNKLSASQ